MPPPPDELLYLWFWFTEHCWGLAANGMMPSIVTWEGLAAWCDLRGIVLEPWEARAMVQLGNMRAAALLPKPVEVKHGSKRPHRANGKNHRRHDPP